MTNPFDEEKLYGGRSALVKMIPDKQGRFEFEIWCQYTRKGLDALQVGDLVAVENYTPPMGSSKTYSVLTLTQVYPTHFANQSAEAYPGHVFESMRGIKEDWERQSERPLQLTTTIVAKSVSTGWQFTYNPRNDELPSLTDEKNLPMVGAEVRPLSIEMVDSIINQGMLDQPESPFYHKKFEELNIKLDKAALLTTHFGIFGFTGVGKSNLVSSMITSLSNNPPDNSNIVIIDPNDEYLGLLIDHFVSHPNDLYYIHVGTDSLPLPIIRELGSTPGDNPDLVNLLRRQMNLPSRLKNNPDINDYMDLGVSSALNRTRIVLPAQDLASLIRGEMQNQTDPRAGPAVREVLQDAMDAWIREYFDTPITTGTLQRALDLGEKFGGPVKQPLTRLQGSQQGTASGVIDRTIRALDRLKRNLEEIPSDAIISTRELIDALNNPNRQMIIIVTARRDSDLKVFSEVMGNQLYESRRRAGLIEPYTLFLFDEADIFIPGEGGDEPTQQIKEFCVTLARRGRKFGLGIGISTQRASLLDTEVMGNLHTYFVSKLPRSYDRQRVAEAFGIGEEQLSPTFTFRPGHWLIISHDATGLKGVPIPTKANDANQRIIDAAGSR
jgi:hypothetical protein